MTTMATTFEEPRMKIRRLAPPLHRALVGLGNEIELDPRLRELVNVRASILNGCAYCIDIHTKAARRAGESERRLHALAAWREAPFFDDRGARSARAHRLRHLDRRPATSRTTSGRRRARISS